MAATTKPKLTTRSTVEKKTKLTKPTKSEISEPVLVAADETIENEESAEILKDEKGERIEKYYEAVGRRKESTARVRVLTKKSTDSQDSENRAIITVNDQPYDTYFNS